MELTIIDTGIDVYTEQPSQTRVVGWPFLGGRDAISFHKRLCLSEVLREEQALAVAHSRMKAQAETSMCKGPGDGKGKICWREHGCEWLDKAGKVIIEGPVFHARSFGLWPTDWSFEHKKTV